MSTRDLPASQGETIRQKEARPVDGYESTLTQELRHSHRGTFQEDQVGKLDWFQSDRLEASIREASNSESTIGGTRQAVPCYQ